GAVGKSVGAAGFGDRDRCGVQRGRRGAAGERNDDDDGDGEGSLHGDSEGAGAATSRTSPAASALPDADTLISPRSALALMIALPALVATALSVPGSKRTFQLRGEASELSGRAPRDCPLSISSTDSQLL